MTLSLSPLEAQDEVLDLFKAGWDLTTFPVFYADIPVDMDPSNTPYIHVEFMLGNSSQVGFGDGLRTYEWKGSLVCKLYTPSGNPKVLSGNPLPDKLELAKVVADSFQGKHTPGGVWFRSVDIQNIGRDGMFYVTSITVRFQFNEVK